MLKLFRIGGDDFVNDAVNLAFVADLHESLLADDGVRALARPEHLNQNFFALLAADFPFFNRVQQAAQFFRRDGTGARV